MVVALAEVANSVEEPTAGTVALVGMVEPTAGMVAVVGTTAAAMGASAETVVGRAPAEHH